MDNAAVRIRLTPSRRFLAAPLIGVALVCCTATPTRGPGTAPHSVDVVTIPSSDGPGDVPLEGVVRIVDVDRSTLQDDGTTRYYVENLTNALVENLVFSVAFYYPPGSNLAPGALRLPYESVGTPEQFLNLQPSDSQRVIVASCPEFLTRRARGASIASTRLTVYVEAPALPLPRTDGARGSTFVGGAIELTGCLDDGLYDTPPSLSLEFENVSQRAVDTEIRVIFLEPDGHTTAGATAWQRLDVISPGARRRVDVDLSGAGRVAGRVCSGSISVLAGSEHGRGREPWSTETHRDS